MTTYGLSPIKKIILVFTFNALRITRKLMKRLSKNATASFNQFTSNFLVRFSDHFFIDAEFDEPCRCCGNTLTIHEMRGHSGISCGLIKNDKTKCEHARFIDNTHIKCDFRTGDCPKKDDEKQAYILRTLWKLMIERLFTDRIVMTFPKNRDNTLIAVMLELNGLAKNYVFGNSLLIREKGYFMKAKLRIIDEQMKEAHLDIDDTLKHLIKEYGKEMIYRFVLKSKYDEISRIIEKNSE